jgi:hypothetical protein
MISRFVTRGALAAIAGAAMLAALSTPAPAFTLSSPSLDQPVASAEIEHVWWDRWGGWHPNGWGWRGPGWGWRPWYRPYWARPVYHPWRRCWWTWRGRVCRWY